MISYNTWKNFVATPIVPLYALATFPINLMNKYEMKKAKKIKKANIGFELFGHFPH